MILFQPTRKVAQHSERLHSTRSSGVIFARLLTSLPCSGLAYQAYLAANCVHVNCGSLGRLLWPPVPAAAPCRFMCTLVASAAAIEPTGRCG